MLEAIAGFLRWRGSLSGAVLALVLLPLGGVFWWGFALMTQPMQAGVLQANGTLAAEPTIDADHVARAVLYMANLPLDVNVPFMTVMATGMPYIGRG
jgi:hypothetical protein